MCPQDEERQRAVEARRLGGARVTKVGRPRQLVGPPPTSYTPPPPAAPNPPTDIARRDRSASTRSKRSDKDHGEGVRVGQSAAGSTQFSVAPMSGNHAASANGSLGRRGSERRGQQGTTSGSGGEKPMNDLFRATSNTSSARADVRAPGDSGLGRSSGARGRRYFADTNSTSHSANTGSTSAARVPQSSTTLPSSSGNARTSTTGHASSSRDNTDSIRDYHTNERTSSSRGRLPPATVSIPLIPSPTVSHERKLSGGARAGRSARDAIAALAEHRETNQDRPSDAGLRKKPRVMPTGNTTKSTTAAVGASDGGRGGVRSGKSSGTTRPAEGFQGGPVSRKVPAKPLSGRSQEMKMGSSLKSGGSAGGKRAGGGGRRGRRGKNDGGNAGSGSGAGGGGEGLMNSILKGMGDTWKKNK